LTALAGTKIRVHSSPVGQTQGRRTWGVKGDKGIIYPGSLMMTRDGEQFCEKVSAVADGKCCGWADIPYALDTAGLVDGAVKIPVRDGIVGWLDSATSTDAVDATLINRTVWLGNDNTAYDSDGGGTRSCPVTLHLVTSEGLEIWIGPQGPTGPTGATGATGATGPTGPAGP
jgi:hypothetical protein